ncbi:hypothetical protein GBA52_016510 [Prunus armeniaca]|nr:hypothetical protein GBA52_016510 [Prunus armeniaca]
MKRPFFKVSIDDSHPYQVVKISAQLPPQIRVDLINFLRENVEVFKGSYESMPRIVLRSYHTIQVPIPP